MSDTDSDELNLADGGYREKPFNIRETLIEMNGKLDATIKTDKEQDERIGSMEVDLGKLVGESQQRKGASKLTDKLIGALGAIVVAGFLGLFGYLWSGNADSTRRDAAIERIDERQTEHSSLPGHSTLDRRVIMVDRRVDSVESTQGTLRRDVDSNASSIQTNEVDISALERRARRPRRFGD